MIAIIDTMRLVTWLTFVSALGAGATVLGYLVAVGVPAAPVPIIHADSTQVLLGSLAALFAAGITASLIALADRFTPRGSEDGQAV